MRPARDQGRTRGPARCGRYLSRVRYDCPATRARLEEAGGLVSQSLAINEKADGRSGRALTYAQLGLLAEETGQPELALDRLTRQLGTPAVEHTWQQVTGKPLPPAVREYLNRPAQREPRRPEPADTIAAAAVSAAAILATELGPALPDEVQAALAARNHAERRPDRYDPLAVAGFVTGAASLVVSLAQLAWFHLRRTTQAHSRPCAKHYRPQGHHRARARGSPP